MNQKEAAVISLYLESPNFRLTEPQLKEGFDIDLKESPNLVQILDQIKKNRKTLSDTQEAYQKLQSPIGQKSQELQFSQIEEVKSSLKEIMAGVEKIKADFSSSIAFSQRSFKYVMVMYIVAFYLGIGLIITAVVFATLDKTILAIAFGTIGLADIIIYFFKEPPNRIQESRATLSAQEMLTTYKEIAADHIKNTEKLLALADKYAEPKK